MNFDELKKANHVAAHSISVAVEYYGMPMFWKAVIDAANLQDVPGDLAPDGEIANQRAMCDMVANWWTGNEPWVAHALQLDQHVFLMGEHPFGEGEWMPARVTREGLEVTGFWGIWFEDRGISRTRNWEDVGEVKQEHWVTGEIGQYGPPGFQEEKPVTAEQALDEAISYFDEQLDGREPDHDLEDESEQNEVDRFTDLRAGLQVVKANLGERVAQ